MKIVRTEPDKFGCRHKFRSFKDGSVDMCVEEQIQKNVWRKSGYSWHSSFFLTRKEDIRILRDLLNEVLGE